MSFLIVRPSVIQSASTRSASDGSSWSLAKRIAMSWRGVNSPTRGWRAAGNSSRKRSRIVKPDHAILRAQREDAREERQQNERRGDEQIDNGVPGKRAHESVARPAEVEREDRQHDEVKQRFEADVVVVGLWARSHT